MRREAVADDVRRERARNAGPPPVSFQKHPETLPRHARSARRYEQVLARPPFEQPGASFQQIAVHGAPRAFSERNHPLFIALPGYFEDTQLSLDRDQLEGAQFADPEPGG